MKLLLANWKTKLQLKEALKVAEAANEDTILFPSIEMLALLAIKFPNLQFGSQDISHCTGPNFTGEINPMTLVDCKVSYCLVGHSERRKYCNETELMLKQKIEIAIKHNITPVICIGSVKTNDQDDLLQQLELLTSDSIASKIIVAYEPVWAIGTGIIPSLNQIQESYCLIKTYNPKAILYGGSVNSKNIKDIINTVDGVLVGGASTDKEELLKMQQLLIDDYNPQSKL